MIDGLNRKYAGKNPQPTDGIEPLTKEQEDMAEQAVLAALEKKKRDFGKPSY